MNRTSDLTRLVQPPCRRPWFADRRPADGRGPLGPRPSATEHRSSSRAGDSPTGKCNWAQRAIAALRFTAHTIQVGCAYAIISTGEQKTYDAGPMEIAIGSGSKPGRLRGLLGKIFECYADLWSDREWAETGVFRRKMRILHGCRRGSRKSGCNTLAVHDSPCSIGEIEYATV